MSKKSVPSNEDLTEKQINEIERRFARKTGDYSYDVRGYLNNYDTAKYVSIDYLVNSMVRDWKADRD